MFSTVLHDMKFRCATCNFHESGHGCGAPDGVVAAVKHAADHIVCGSTDILNANLYESLVAAKLQVTLHLIETESVQTAAENMTTVHVKPIPGTMQLHQVVCTEPAHISYRCLSCYCDNYTFCDCYEPKSFIFRNSVKGTASAAFEEVESRDLNALKSSYLNSVIHCCSSMFWCSIRANFTQAE